MRTPVQLRLSLTTLVVLLFGMGIAAVLAWLSVEQLYLKTQRENLLAQAQLTASALYGTSFPSAPAEPYLQTSNVQPGIHTRLLGEQGAVVVNLPIAADDSPVQVPLAENAASISPQNLLQRPEIESSLEGIPATAVRRVVSANNRRVLYAAAPVFAAGGDIIGIVYLATPLPPASLPTNIVLQLVGAFLVAVFLAGATGAFLSWRIAHPLEQLVAAARAVASGNLAQHVPTDSDIRELHNLGEAFNNMTANLRQADQAKNVFVADVTHELRTPLTVINGTIETLEDGAIDDLEGRGPLLKSMQSETKRLIRLVNDLLVLTRADAGALNLKIECVDLVELVRARCTSLAALAEPRRVVLTIEAQEQTKVWGDADRLIQVLDNLLDNAIRHAPDESAVTVIIQGDGHEVRCAVSDHGPGIPVQHLPFIFERFYRADTSRNRHTGGSGLGLAIVRSLVLAQSGRITAESVEGQGTTITFWLPTDENCLSTA
ncbi:MAG: HAMP domain-containing protein [Anaerolineales bacterium]|nr:HAMP domain-containing protein [Anaerolineales bacterium]